MRLCVDDGEVEVAAISGGELWQPPAGRQSSGRLVAGLVVAEEGGGGRSGRSVSHGLSHSASRERAANALIRLSQCVNRAGTSIKWVELDWPWPVPGCTSPA